MKTNNCCGSETQKNIFNSIFKFKSMKTMLRRVVAIVCLMFAMVATVEAQNSFAYQAVIRTAKGELVSNQEIGMQFSLIYNNKVVYCETQKPTTNQYGNVQVEVGKGQKVSGDFAAVPWSTMQVMMRIEADPNGGTNYIDLGTIQLQPAPYAMYAPAAGAVSTVQAGDPKSDSNALFEVKDKDGNVVFAVYPDGVRVFVDDADSTNNKAMRTGFAVAGRRAAKEGNEADIFSVTTDGTQVFVSEEDTAGGKAMRTGFAVSGRRAAKDLNADLFTVSSTGTQIYISNDEDGDKAMRTGFAVSGRRAAKDDAASDNYLEINADGTRVYIDDTTDNSGKAMRTGFAVSGRRAAKGNADNKYMEITADGTQVYVDDDEKAMRTGFAVAGRRAAKGNAPKLFEVNSFGTQIYIETEGKPLSTGFAVAGRRAAKEDSQTPKYLVIDADGTRIYVDYEEAKAMRTGFAVSGRRAAKDGTPNTILTVDNEDGTRVYIEDNEGKAMRTGFAVSGRRAAKDGDSDSNRDDRMRITSRKSTLTAQNFAMQDKRTNTNMMSITPESTKINTDLFVLKNTENDEQLFSTNTEGAEVNANIVLLGEHTQSVESEQIGNDTILLVNEIATLQCAQTATVLGEADGYQLLKIYGSDLYAPAPSFDADSNNYILFDALGDVTSAFESAMAAVVMTNATTDSAKVLIWPLKQNNNLIISFGVMTSDSTDQYVKVTAVINSAAGVERKVDVLAENGSVEVSGYQVYGEIVSVEAKNAEGYHFAQWSDGNSNNPRTTRFTGAIAFTAMFGINTYSITVNPTEGGSVEGAGTYNYGDTATLKAIADEHYHFVSWNDNNTESEREIVVKADWELTPTFELDTFLVAFVNGSDTLQSTYMKYAQKPEYRGKTPEKADDEQNTYSFRGWSPEITETTTVQGEQTYTAQFEATARIFSITTAITDEAGNPLEGQIEVSGNLTYNSKVTLTAPDLQEGVFLKWSDDNERNPREVIITEDASFTAIYKTSGNQITVYAQQCKAVSGLLTKAGSTTTETINFASSNGIFTYTCPQGAKLTIHAEPEEGYEFAGWLVEETTIEGDYTIENVKAEISLTASIEAVEYSISYDYDGGSLAQGASNPSYYYVTDNEITLAEPIKEGYDFKGWKEKVDDGAETEKKSVVIATGSTGNRRYTALWEKQKYDIAAYVYVNETFGFVSDGGSVLGGGTYKYGSEATLTAMVKQGYKFVGWFDGDGNEIEVDGNVDILGNELTIAEVKGHATYYAAFTFDTKKLTVKISEASVGQVKVYGSDGKEITLSEPEGSVATLDGSTPQPTWYAYIVKGETVTLEAVANDGYVFKNWNGNQNLTTATLNNVEISEDVEYTATFVATRHIEIAIPNDAGSVTASIDLEEGASTEDTTILYADCEIGTTVTLTADPEGKYKFKGWKVGGEIVGTSAEYEFTLNENVRIVAVFEAPIIYVSSGGKAGNSGLSANEPLPSIAEALNCIPDDENEENWMDWEIRIIGTLKGAQSLETEPIMNEEENITGYEPIAAKSITIIGNTGLDEYNQPQDVIDGGWRKTVNEYETWKNEYDESAYPSPALTIKNVSAPVIIKNLAITGGYVYENGGGLFVESSSKYPTKVTIDDGMVIRGNKALCGGGVYVYSTSYYDYNNATSGNGVAEVTMKGGIIGGDSEEDANRADFNWNMQTGGGGVLVDGADAKFSMQSGSIKGNIAGGFGGGICAYGGALFEMEDGSTIENNRTANDDWSGVGGGVCIRYESEFKMNGGSITDNKALTFGGGVYVDGGTITMEGESDILGNHASSGGGVYLSPSSILTMTGGSISGNVADFDGNGVYLEINNAESIGVINMSGTAIIDSNNDVCLCCVWNKNAVINVGQFTLSEEIKVATITPAGNTQEEDFYLIGDNSEFGRFDVSPIINEQGNIEFYTITSEGKLQKKEDAALIAVYYDYNETSQRSELKTYMNLKPSDEGYIDSEELENYDYEPPKTPDGSSIEYVFDGWYVNYGDGYERFNFDQPITTTTVIYGMFSANIDAEEDDKLSDMVKFMDDPLTNYYINFQSSIPGPQVIEQPAGHQLPNSITLQGNYNQLYGGWAYVDGMWDYWGYYSDDDFDPDFDFEQFIEQPVLTIRTKAPIIIKNLEIVGGYSTGILEEAEGCSLTLGQGTRVTGNGYYNDGNPSYYDEDDQLCCIGVDIHPKCELYMEGNARVADDNLIVLRTDLSLYSVDYPRINIDGLDDEDDVVAVIDPTSFSSWTVLTGTSENISKQCGRFKVVPYYGNQYGVDASGNIAQLISVTFKDGNEVLTDLTQYVASGGYATEPKAPIKIGYTLTGWYDVGYKRLFNFSETQITESLELEAVWESWMVEEDGHFFVDLGTGDNTLWASTNVGAENVWDFGDYYAWGETEPRYTIGGDGTLSWKSTYNGYDGTKSSTFNYEDVATTVWGESSSMPTDEQIQSLVRSGYWVWTDSYNGKGKSGFIVYKLKDGDSHQVYYRGSEPYDSYSLADVHIFLPAAGYYANKKLYDGSEHYTTYWSKTTYWDDNSKAYTLIMYGPPRSSSGVNCVYSAKWSLGNPVRPVTKAKCTISFDSQGGNDIVPIKVEKGTVPSAEVGPTPERANKVFAGWYSDPDCTEAKKFQFGVSQLISDTTLYAKWVETWMIGDGNGHYYVDLGIGALWATANMGSETPDYHDDYISWSEDLGTTWGDGWYAPTRAQFAELATCSMEYTSNYANTSKKGVIVYAKSNTTNSLEEAHIFIPFEGYWQGSYIEDTERGSGFYWTSEMFDDDLANYINFSEQESTVIVAGDETSEHSYMEKDKGLSVRLIRKKENGTSQANLEDFVLVEAGCYMGKNSWDPEYSYDAEHDGEIFVPNMYVCKHEVTQAEWEKYMTYYGVAVSGEVEGQSDSELPYKPDASDDKANTPVYYISWVEAITYCNLRSLADNLTPVYSLMINGTKQTNPANWSDAGIVADGNGKYYSQDNVVGYNIPANSSYWSPIPSEGGHFYYDETANGYRLPNVTEWVNIATKNSAAGSTLGITNNAIVDVYEYCRAYTGGGGAEGDRYAMSSIESSVFDFSSDGSYYQARRNFDDSEHDKIGLRVVCTATGNSNGGTTSYIGSKLPGATLAVGDIVFNDGSAEYYTSLTDAQKPSAIAVIFDASAKKGVGLVQSATMNWATANARIYYESGFAAALYAESHDDDGS